MPQTWNHNGSSPPPRGGPIGCDMLLALGSETSDGSVLLAKNSDRHQAECQHLRTFPAADQTNGSSVRCQYLSISQTTRTHGMLGSQPFWLWGFEHGVNDRGVAIGNEAIWMNAPHPPVGLMGMDMIRLALERTSSAEEALEVVTGLLASHGQGGSARFWDTEAPGYDNSFFLADPHQAWVLETCGRDWVARPARPKDCLSNVPTIETDFQTLSDSLAGRDGLNFARDMVAPDRPHADGRARLARSRKLLDQHGGALTAADMMRFLRDRGADEDSPPSLGSLDVICMHPAPPEEVGVQTVASMVAHLRPEGSTVWCSVATPDVAPFLPFYPDVAVPDGYAAGTDHPHPDSIWWRFKRLQGVVEADWTRAYPVVRARWETLESALLAAAPDYAGAPAETRAAWVRENVREMLSVLGQLEHELNVAGNGSAAR